MKINIKISLIVLPLIIAPLLIAGSVAALAARNGITQVTTEFLRFKSEQLQSYAETQWNLLIENDLTGNPDFVRATQSAVESFSQSLIRRDTELIFALDDEGIVVMSSNELSALPEEITVLQKLLSDQAAGWYQFSLDDVDRVAELEYFAPFGWYIFVTEQKQTFYRSINSIYWYTGLIIMITLTITMVSLFLFVRYITNPLHQVVRAMQEMITNNDFSTKVDLLYEDEIGDLGHTFNLMTGELEKAYTQIKSYAFQAVIAQRKEQKIRNIFQKYVPRDVIDQFFINPEAMLTGDSRVLAVLFSDIRSFSTISESLLPEQIVESLNTYFGMMVDIILERQGIVDKFIGDAIMAFYGAPVKHEDDALQAALSGLDMLDALEKFNDIQVELGRPRFRIGIGLNYGVVTVGNIGSEKKMDYTVIGDMVNVASRLEELTKVYQQPFIFSESVYQKVAGVFPCRLIDKVALRGRKEGTKIFTARRELSGAEEKAWDLHSKGMELYFQRKFEQAEKIFNSALDYLSDDLGLKILKTRCEQYAEYPPEDDWNGTITLAE